MRLDRVTVTNFRGFVEKTISFAPQFNVLIGDNGAGKTAFLDAVAVAVGSFFLGWDRLPTRSIRLDETRRTVVDTTDVPYIDLHFPVQVTAEGQVGDEHIQWTRALLGEGRHTTHGRAKHIQYIASRLQAESRERKDVVLPLISYYGTGRVWLQKRRRGIETVSPGQRRRGYANCLDAESNESLLLSWFKTLEISVIQRRSENGTLEGVRSAVAKCMDRWTRVYYDVLLDQLMTESSEGEKLPVRLLSDGQRNVLFIVLDIAYRAATLNPSLGFDAATRTPGIVLIDEIDLHLHPKWQRRIVEALRSAFPQVQFITTTHSPNIIQSLRAGELIDLNDGDPGPYLNASPEDILENVMDVPVPQRSERSKKMIEAAEEYYSLLRQARGLVGDELQTLKRRLDVLLEPYADDEAYIAFLRQQRLAAGLDGENACAQ